MYDSVEATQEVSIRAGRWLLFIHQIPPKPDYFRIKVRRRLQAIGAVALKNSVYLLPQNDETMEDFQWLRRMIVDDGGEATLLAASFIEGVNDQEVESMFRERADSDYEEIIEAIRAVEANPKDADLRRLKRQLGQAAARDFFAAPRGEAARLALDQLESSLIHRRAPLRSPPTERQTERPRGATWVTRKGVHVDRIASAWLIRRFIDRSAQFKFVPAEGYEPEPGEIRFDMFEGEFTHEGDSCTFEVLVARFVASDAALAAIAEIVHDIDCKDEKFGRDEAAGVASLIHGIGLGHSDDTARIEAGSSLFEALYVDLSPR